MNEFKGILYGWFETGTEGVVWTLTEDGKQGYEAMKELRTSDNLKVFAEDGSVLFDGVIDEDTETGYEPYPMNPEFGQPCALGYRVHWTQRGWQPDDWAALFMRGDRPQLRAELRRAKDTICTNCWSDGYDDQDEKNEQNDICKCGKELRPDGSDSEEMEYHCCESCARQDQVCKMCGGTPVITK